MIKKLSFSALVFLSTLFISFGASKVAYAQMCQPTKNVFEKILAIAQNLDIIRTTTNMVGAMITDIPMGFITGGSGNQFAGCIKMVEQKIGQSFPGTADCVNDAEEQKYCEGVFNLYATSKADAGMNFAQSRVAGSLLGMALYTENAVKEPIPINLAMYVKDKVQDIPIINTALAADPAYAIFLNSNDAVGKFVLDVWKQIRNIAYALMAIVMLVVGFMIITRKKINQQVVVNIQYAIPQMVIAIILITFSYPIGATIATFGWNLGSSMNTIIGTMFSGNFGAAAKLSEMGIGAVGAAMWNNMLASVGAGLVFAPMSVILLIGVFGAWLYVRFKEVLLYLKLIIKTVSSPIVFAIGSIPGTENNMERWFKEMLSGALAIVAMEAVVQLSVLAVAEISIENAANTWGGGNAFFGFIGGTFSIILIPGILMFGCYYAGQMPEMIESFIVGDPKKGGKR